MNDKLKHFNGIFGPKGMLVEPDCAVLDEPRYRVITQKTGFPILMLATAEELNELAKEMEEESND